MTTGNQCAAQVAAAEVAYAALPCRARFGQIRAESRWPSGGHTDERQDRAQTPALFQPTATSSVTNQSRSPRHRQRRNVVNRKLGLQKRFGRSPESGFDVVTTRFGNHAAKARMDRHLRRNHARADAQAVWRMTIFVRRPTIAHAVSSQDDQSQDSTAGNLAEGRPPLRFLFCRPCCYSSPPKWDLHGGGCDIEKSHPIEVAEVPAARR